jgi:regulator of protease activity HflC (stomatin/prohibitin superfamily)
MVGCPMYNVYSYRKAGEAALAHAQSSKEVAVAEAKAKMESATLLAQAEIERAKGVAGANKIIGDSLRDNEAYLRYLWITDVAGTNIDKTVVYVPTEANLPLMEAGRTPMMPKK